MKKEDIKQAISVYSLVLFWIAASSTVILFNKYVLSVYGFPLPIVLTMCHMTFCSLAASLLINVLRVVEPVADLDLRQYVKSVVPIAALYTVVLWLGNSAYLYLSVSFIQMLKAFMPVLVFSLGVVLGTETMEARVAGLIAVIATGVFIAAYGELHFHGRGFVMQVASMMCEAVRLQLIQMLMQGKKKMNSVQTLYYVSPACALFLFVPFYFVEKDRFFQFEWHMDWHILLLNCSVALALNIAVFLLIGKTSALTMNVAGVIKDWELMLLSYLLFHHPITSVQIGGYFIAFSGVSGYNYHKYMTKRLAEEEKSRATMLPVSERNGGLRISQHPHLAVHPLPPADVK